jgi:outer membrane protein
MKHFGIHILVSSAILLTTSNALAGKLSSKRDPKPITLGAGVIWEDKIYRDFDDDDKTSVVPVIFYEGERLFFRADTLGWKLFKSDAWEIAPILELGQEGYDSSDSDFLDGMSDRDPWIGVGGHVIFQPNSFGARLSAAGDVTDESNGGRVVTEGFYDTRIGNIKLNANIGTIWGSEGYSEYYYGVESNEVIPNIRPAYDPDTTLSYFAGGSAVYQKEDSPWMLIGFLRYTFFDDDIDDSPITSDDQMAAVGVGIAYTFRRK